MSLQFYTGNRLEVLATLYCSHARSGSTADPLQKELVIVQTQGMASYLKQFIAMECGVAANLEMPFPNSFIENLIRQQFPEFRSSLLHYSQEAMTREIYLILEEKPGDYPELQYYLLQEHAELRCWQLAEKISELFDRCQVYRYQQADSPLTGNSWQTRLWKELHRRFGPGRDHFYAEFLKSEAELTEVPQHFAVFGVGSLPPLYLDAIFRISKQCHIDFFYLNPCCRYWEELTARRKRTTPPDAGEIEVGNPLLASWGEAGRELFSNLLQHEGQLDCQEEKLFVRYDNTETPTVLQKIQQDILEMRDARIKPQSCTPDGSIEILNCHAPKREVEILHDKLLELFSTTALTPRDVIVMAPDINDYAPLIEAVFAQGKLKECFTVSDRTLRSGSAICGSFRTLLHLPESRLTAVEVLDLLAQPVIGRAFGIGREELEQLRTWITQAGIRWGADQQDRQEICGVAFDEYAWLPALDRMFLLFARGMTDEEKSLGGLPEITENEAALFGRFSDFVHRLTALRKELAECVKPALWGQRFFAMLDHFFSPETEEDRIEFSALQRLIAQTMEEFRNCSFASPLPVEVMEEALARGLAKPQGHFSFLRGKITFCSLTPLRSIPCGVIAILGMNERAFPRRDKESGFNLLAEHRCGDRSGAQEDRYLFLEALMSARHAFWLFYDGHSRRDEKKYPPSPVAAELAEYLLHGYGIAEICHKRQAFDAEYFTAGSKLRSLSQENFRICRKLYQETPQPPRSQFDFQLPPPETEPPDFRIALETLIRWAKNPVQCFLKERLDLAVGEIVTEPETEMMTPDPLEIYSLRSSLNTLQRQNLPDERSYELLKSANRLPPGELGRRCCKQLQKELQTLPEAWKNRFFTQEKLALQFQCPAASITGMLTCDPTLSSQKLLFFGSCKHKYHVEALLRHRMLRMVSDSPCVVTEFCCLQKGQWKFFRFSDEDKEISARFWEEFLPAYQAAQRQLPVLFPGVLFKLGHGAKWEQARSLFPIDSWTGFGDLSDPALARCFTQEAVDDPQNRQAMERFAAIFYSQLPEEVSCHE